MNACKILLTLVIALLCVTGQAQISIKVPGVEVSIGSQHTGSANNATKGTESGGNIDPDAEIEGVTIINDKVFIDGEQVPRGQKLFTTKKTRKTYAIRWGQNGAVSVSEK